MTIISLQLDVILSLNTPWTFENNDSEIFIQKGEFFLNLVNTETYLFYIVIQGDQLLCPPAALSSSLTASMLPVDATRVPIAVALAVWDHKCPPQSDPVSENP